ncbi:MAG TPA: GntR family transcriptional regulator [Paracoccus sp. (in: a-proteobacteria)]|uniref:GntR family transcriptional regulator n=1 Tax=Paracoccus sp. TaxID=267 RepID=UPI002B7850F6|nr:GntR family transcriptional regulator [Paracoccus sp. (in: a-proteobacteria)]HWL57764.1 GntR family transcriptional regulator [Paracoccus sp. (in: a-proteobacteria)]
MADPHPRGFLTERIIERLRSAIMEGELQLGELLSEDKLALSLGVSRSPVRKAFAALEQQGLIVVRPQRGSFVFWPTARDIDDLAQFRRLIEVEMLRLAFRDKRGVTLAAMKHAAQTMHHALGTGDTLGAARADMAYHDAMLENCDNSYLLDAYRMVAGKVAALRSHRAVSPTQLRASAEHFLIIEMLERGDLSGASDLLGEHILKMADRFKEELPIERRPGRGPVLDRIGPLED